MATEVCTESSCHKPDEIQGMWLHLELRGEEINHDWEHIWLPAVKNVKQFRSVVKAIQHVLKGEGLIR